MVRNVLTFVEVRHAIWIIPFSERVKFFSHRCRCFAASGIIHSPAIFGDLDDGNINFMERGKFSFRTIEQYGIADAGLILQKFFFRVIERFDVCSDFH